MSQNGQYISAPIGISDIQSLIGASSADLGSLCKHENINKWAIYKPEKNSKIDKITLADRKKNHMGLYPVEITILKNTAYGVVNVSISDVESAIREWPYQKPTGGASSQYRISDFLNDEMVTSNGYNHLAVAPDSDWGDVERAKPSSTNNLTVLVSNFSFRTHEDSASNIGSANSNFLPLSYLFSNDEMNNMYIGVAIYVPNQGFLFCHGTTSIGTVDSTSRGGIFPNLSTNQYLRDMLTDSEYTFIPCLLYNPQEAKVQEQAQRTYVNMSMGKVYCMPSGAKSFKLKFNTAINNTSKTFTFNGVNVTGYYISGTYSISFPGESSRLAYLIKGYVNTATGKTTGGWFVTTVMMSNAAYGFRTHQIVVVYATTDGDSNTLKLTDEPPESISVNEYLYCQYLTDLGSNPKYVQYGYTLTSGSISKTNKVSVTNSWGTTSFYGYVSEEIRVGLSVIAAR